MFAARLPQCAAALYEDEVSAYALTEADARLASAIGTEAGDLPAPRTGSGLIGCAGAIWWQGGVIPSASAPHSRTSPPVPGRQARHPAAVRPACAQAS
ncbi:hypothetical protein [Streptomyces sp. NPDC026673]|uniref:hypothetical protein n=1 Tax=Streptomyces sp. NPDC026673 TaxID=3155724 RepID=UPI0033E36CFA